MLCFYKKILHNIWWNWTERETRKEYESIASNTESYLIAASQCKALANKTITQLIIRFVTWLTTRYSIKMLILIGNLSILIHYRTQIAFLNINIIPWTQRLSGKNRFLSKLRVKTYLARLEASRTCITLSWEIVPEPYFWTTQLIRHYV